MAGGGASNGTPEPGLRELGLGEIVVLDAEGREKRGADFSPRGASAPQQERE
jgi:hypothetical protein